MSQTLGTQLAMDALNMAIAHRGPPVTLHSDQGSTYATGGYREIIHRYGITQSMSRKGDCWDNAPMESFWATLKGELVAPRDYDYPTRDAARADVFQYIEGFYNRRRLHSGLGYLTPEQKLVAFQAATSAAQQCP